MNKADLIEALAKETCLSRSKTTKKTTLLQVR